MTPWFAPPQPYHEPNLLLNLFRYEVDVGENWIWLVSMVYLILIFAINALLAYDLYRLDSYCMKKGVDTFYYLFKPDSEGSKFVRNLWLTFLAMLVFYTWNLRGI